MSISPTERLTVLLMEVAREITAKAADSVAPLHLREVAALLAIAKLPTPSQHEVGRHTGMDRTTVGKVVRGLEHQGLVIRQVGPHDNRRQGVTLTSAGRAALTDVDRAFARCDDEFMISIEASQRDELRTILSRLLDHSSGSEQ